MDNSYHYRRPLSPVSYSKQRAAASNEVAVGVAGILSGGETFLRTAYFGFHPRHFMVCCFAARGVRMRSVQGGRLSPQPCQASSSSESPPLVLPRSFTVVGSESFW